MAPSSWACRSHPRAIKETYGLERLLLDRTGTQVPRAPFEPTCNIAGMGGGYQGPGSKTIVPARAAAKVDFRLVPDQDPSEIQALLCALLDMSGFADVAIAVLGAEYPGITDADDPLVRLTVETGEEVYGLPARVTPLTGGTTPLYLFTRQGVPVVAPGVGYHRSNAHRPDEHVRLEDFRRAGKHLARVMQRFPNL